MSLKIFIFQNTNLCKFRLTFMYDDIIQNIVRRREFGMLKNTKYCNQMRSCMDFYTKRQPYYVNLQKISLCRRIYVKAKLHFTEKTLVVIRILLMLIETIKYTFRATPNIPKLVIIPFRYSFVELALFTQTNLSNCRVSGLYTRSQFLPMIQ